MDIKLISLTKNDPSEFAMAKKTISDCANAFNSEAEKFKNFANSILPYNVETIQQINIEDY